MITIQSRMHVDGIGGTEIFNFLIDPSDREYQRWWPGTHLELHALERRPNHVGDVIYMDEFIGKYRMKMKGVVTEAVAGKKIVWEPKIGIRLPVRLILELEDDATGVRITHTIRAGFEGPGRILDPLFRIYLSREFEQAMDEHARIEFPKLRDLLRGSAR
ncbi:MAG: hypothetical protein AB1640_25170 [bacterium]